MRKLFCKSQKSLVIMRMSILNYFTMSILNYFISKTNKQKKHMRLFASLLMECIHMLPNSKEFTVKSRVSPKSGFQVQLPRGNHRLLINIYLKITVIFFFRKWVQSVSLGNMVITHVYAKGCTVHWKYFKVAGTCSSAHPGTAPPSPPMQIRCPALQALVPIAPHFLRGAPPHIPLEPRTKAR